MPRFRSEVVLCTDCTRVVVEGDGVPMYQAQSVGTGPLRFMCEHVRREELQAARARGER